MRINIIILLSIFIYIQPQTDLYIYSKTYESPGETSINSQSENEDFRKCSCDLFPNYCDHRCCCDIKCISRIKYWKDNNLCLNVDNNKLSNHYCYGRHGLSHEKNDSFTWNLKNSPLLHSDQIFKLFCVRHDRTKNKIDEQYKEDDNINSESLYQIVTENSYFNNIVNTQRDEIKTSNLKLGDKIKIIINNKFCVYKVSPYGIRLKEAIFRFSYPTEGYFILSEDNCKIDDKLNVNINTNNNEVTNLKQLIIQINNNASPRILLELKSENIQKCHISIIWSLENHETDIINSGNPGYLIGKNVLIVNEDNIYNIGYFIYGADENGNCMDENSEEDSVVNIQSIKFKQNSIYSCKYLIQDCSIDYQNTLKIFQSANHIKDILIGKFGNSDRNNEEEWINVTPDDDLPNEEDLYIIDNECLFPTKIYLEILVTKFLTKGQPQEMIIGAKLKYSWERIVISREYKISFITKYVVVSEELFENQGKQTSLYPITSPNFRKP